MTAPLPAGDRRPLHLKTLLPRQVVGYLAADARLIVPVGTCEQRGPHLPLGSATLIAERLADDLSARYGVLRAPTVEYGVNVGTERDFPGNASMRRKTLHRMLNDLLASLEGSGFREFILLTAHDHDPHQEALATVVTATARVRVVDIFAVPVGDLLEGQRDHLHGDEVDTSILLYIAPDLVRMDLARDHEASRETVRRYRRGWLRISRKTAGSIGRPTLASAEKGKLIYDRILDRISERIFRAPDPDE
jgi:creatinine amidohydrolase